MQEATATPIRDQRLRRGLTQRELAVQCLAAGASISDSQLSKIERGRCMPYPRLRAVLAQILELDIDLQRVDVQHKRESE